MKTFCRILLVFLGLLTITALIAYYVVTSPALQKKLIEYRLPKGSSIEAVQITKESIELTDLRVFLPNGAIMQIDSIYSEFSIYSVLFEESILLSGIKLDGLKIKLLESKALRQTSLNPMAVSSTDNLSSVRRILSGALHFIGDIKWRFNIDPIEVSGELIDNSNNSHTFAINTTQVAPGVESIVRADIGIKSVKASEGVLKNFDSVVELIFTQKDGGGFEQIRLVSLVESTGISGDLLLSLRQDLDLSFVSLGEVIKIDLSFNADIARPNIFVPELVGTEGISLKGFLKATLEGDQLILNVAEVDSEIQNSHIATLKLKEDLNLSSKQNFFGEMMKVNLINFPLNLISPWLGDEVQLSGEPISAEVLIEGERSGAIKVRTLQPFQLGPFSIKKGRSIFLDQVILRTNPVLSIDSEGVILYDLGNIQLVDRYGEIIKGRINGSKKFASGDSLLLGSQIDAKFNLDLSGIFKQPILKGRTSVMAGQAELIIKIDNKEKYPAYVRAHITGLRTRNSPALREEYSFFSQFKETKNGEYIIESNFSIGTKDNPSSNVQILGQIIPNLNPVPFKVNLIAPTLSQSDVENLYSVLKTQQGSSSDNPFGQNTRSSDLGASRPYWTNLDGEVVIKLDELIMASGHCINDVSALITISEPTLSTKQLEASIKNSALSCNAKVTYNFEDTIPYQISSASSFYNIDPSIFSKKRSGNFPMKGFFDGSFNLKGQGKQLITSLDDARYDFTITGRDGSLTVFELDERSQLGLLGASILGKSLNRPGISAMSRAIPYFKDVHFDSFILKLVNPANSTINISKFSIQGNNLKINGIGSIASSKLNGFIDKPLMLTLEFGARGRLIDHLEILGLLSPSIDIDGFRALNKSINIGGTVSNPDSKALKQVLNQAASRAFAQPSSSESRLENEERPLQYKQESREPNINNEKSKEEKILENIETGLNILDSIFG